MFVVVLIALAVALFVMGDPRLRKLTKETPGRTLFFTLCLLLLVTTAVRSGRPWLGLLAGIAVVWGPRLLGAGRVARKVTGASSVDATHRPGRMTRKEALAVLDLPTDATRDEISQRYRQIIQTVHPDRGGSHALARQVNEAKSVLLD